MGFELKYAPGIDYEEEVLEFIKNIPEGGVFYDLGACVGGFSLLALLRNLKVIAFEVDENNYDGLLENYKNNLEYFPKDHYFKHFQIGIADKKGTANLRVGQPEIGGHWKTLDTEYYSASDNIIHGSLREVNIDSLDNLIKEKKLPTPEYIKIDIDGSEYAFILGAKKSLKKCKSLIIELQIDNKFYPEINETLLKLGFKETFRSTKDLGVPCLHNIIYSK